MALVPADLTTNDIKTAEQAVVTAQTAEAEEKQKKYDSPEAVTRRAWVQKRNTEIGDPATVSERKKNQYKVSYTEWLKTNPEPPKSDSDALNAATANLQAKRDALQTLKDQYRAHPRTDMCNHIHSVFMNHPANYPNWQWHKNKKTEAGNLVMYFVQKIKFGDTLYWAVAHIHSKMDDAGRASFVYANAADKLDIFLETKLPGESVELSRVCEKWEDLDHRLGDVITTAVMNAHKGADPWPKSPNEVNAKGVTPGVPKVYPASVWTAGDLYVPEWGRYVDSVQSPNGLGSASASVAGYADGATVDVMMSAMILLVVLFAILCFICSFCIGGVLGFAARFGWKPKADEVAVDHAL